MPNDQAYECANCKNQKMSKEAENTPECCGQPMSNIPMDQCTLATTAEHSRFDKDDEPCDDGRAG